MTDIEWAQRYPAMVAFGAFTLSKDPRTIKIAKHWLDILTEAMRTTNQPIVWDRKCVEWLRFANDAVTRWERKNQNA